MRFQYFDNLVGFQDASHQDQLNQIGVDYCNLLDAARFEKMPSANGDRQIFPKQTNNTRYILHSSKLLSNVTLFWKNCVIG